MGAKRQAKKELAKEAELAKLRAAEARKKTAKEQQRKAAAARAAAHQRRLSAMSTEERTAYDKRQARLMGVLSVIILLFIGGCIYAGANEDGSDGDTPSATDAGSDVEPAVDGAPSVDQDEQEFAAFDICTEFVRDQLKAPGTAEFRNYFEDDGEVLVTGTGLGPYTVASTVDSENSFGGEVRTPFVCTVTNAGGDDRWVLDDLQLME